MPRSSVLSLAVASALVVAACSNSDTDDAASAGPIPASTDGGAAPDRAPDDAPATSAPPTSTSSTTTTIPEPPPPTLRLEPIPVSDSDVAPIAQAHDLTVSGSGRLLIAGDIRPAPGEPTSAALWTSPDATALDVIELPAGDSTESAAYDVESAGDQVTVVGLVVREAGPRPAVWTSVDGGASWTGPEELFDGTGSVIAVDRIGDDPIVVWRRTTPTEPQLVAARSVDGTWIEAPIPVTGTDATVAGLAVVGDRVLVTGQARVDSQQTGKVWWSDDGGASFQEKTDPPIAGTYQVGAPVPNGGGFAAVMEAQDGIATVLTTDDGTNWQTTAIGFPDENGERFDFRMSAAHPLVPLDDGFAVGVSSPRGTVAVIDGNGLGTMYAPLRSPGERFMDPHPFIIDGALSVLGRNEASFAIARVVTDDLPAEITARPENGRGRPIDNVVDLFATGDGLVVRSEVYPDVRVIEATGTMIWGPAATWSLLGPSGPTPYDMPDDSVLLATVEPDAVAMGATFDDEEDAPTGGPAGGTTLNTRTGDGWSEHIAFLTGPGGEMINDIGVVGTGLIAVGVQRLQDADGSRSSNPVLRTIDDARAAQSVDRWTTPAIDGELGYHPVLTKLVVSGDEQLVAAIGTTEDDRTDSSLLLVQDGETWRRIDLPTDSPEVDIEATSALENGVLLLANEDGRRFGYRSADGVTWDRTPLDFPNQRQSEPSLVAEVDGRVLIVGTTNVASVLTFAAWLLDGDGTITTVDVPDAPSGRQLELTSLEVVDGVVYVGGLHHLRNTVWQLDTSEL